MPRTGTRSSFHSPFTALLMAGAWMLMLSVAGCGSSNQQAKGEQTSVVYNKDKLVCKQVLPTGSHIPRTECHRRKEVEQRRDADQAKMRDLQHGGSLDLNGGGN